MPLSAMERVNPDSQGMQSVHDEKNDWKIDV
jgi:hypothetical protein